MSMHDGGWLIDWSLIMKFITTIDMGITQTDQYELDLARRWIVDDKIMKLIIIINMDLNQTQSDWSIWIEPCKKVESRVVAAWAWILLLLHHLWKYGDDDDDDDDDDLWKFGDDSRCNDDDDDDHLW